MGDFTEHDGIDGVHPDPPPLDQEAKQLILFELATILDSRPFRSSPRSKQFLSYVVRNYLSGHFENLKERMIGIEVFERDPNYPTAEDSVVRVNAGEVRRRLEQYYHSASKDLLVYFTIPIGSYVPEFHWTSRVPPHQLPPASGMQVASDVAPMSDESLGETQVKAVVLGSESPDAFLDFPHASHQIRRMRVEPIFARLIIILLATACITLWMQNRAANRLIYSWRGQPAIDAFWSEFLDAGSDTDVVLPDMTFAIIEHIVDKPFSFADYLNRSYLTQLQNLSPDKRAMLGEVSQRSLVNSNGLRLAQRFLALDPLGKKIHVYNAQDYMPALFKQDNVILIGAPTTNPWDDLFESQMNFTQNAMTSPGTITNRAPSSGEQATYTKGNGVNYCVVAYLPNPASNGSVLLMQGTNGEATEACGDFLLSEGKLTSFEKMLHVTKLLYFEVLLKTTQIRDTPLTTTIEAYRVHKAEQAGQ